MSDLNGLTGPERRAIVIMVRWAREAGYRRLWWSVPNDASWPGAELAGVAVRHDNLSTRRFDLWGRARWRTECTVCSLLRDDDGYRVEGVPVEEWWRPANQVVFAPDFSPAGEESPLPGGGWAPEPEDSPPGRGWPRLRWAAAALVVVAVPATTLGGLTLIGSGERPASVTAPAPGAVRPLLVAAVPPLPVSSVEWAQQVRDRREAAQGRLRAVTDAEAAWAAAADQHRAGGVPAPVVELRGVRADLAAASAQASADLAAWESLQGARTDLGETSRRLAEVRAELARADSTETAALTAAEARLAAAEGASRERVDAGQREVIEAMAAPAPDVPDAQTVPRVAAEVHKIAAAPPEPSGPDREDPSGPLPVVAGREVEADAAVPVGDGEPDDDGPLDEDVSEPDDPADGGVTEAVAEGEAEVARPVLEPVSEPAGVVGDGGPASERPALGADTEREDVVTMQEDALRQVTQARAHAADSVASPDVSLAGVPSSPDSISGELAEARAVFESPQVRDALNATRDEVHNKIIADARLAGAPDRAP